MLLTAGVVGNEGKVERSEDWALSLERGRRQAETVADVMEGSGWGIIWGWNDLETGIWIRPIHSNTGQADESWNIYPRGAFDT